MSINDLPEELLTSIFTNLEITVSAELPPRNGYHSSEHQKLAALASLSLVNHKFHRIVGSHLYQTVYVPNRRGHPLDCYFRTFIRRPDLALEVKHIHVQGWETLDFEDAVAHQDSSRLPSPDPEEIEESLSLVKDSDLSMPQRGWLEDILKRYGQSEPQLALILLRCSNVEVLDLIPPDWTVEVRNILEGNPSTDPSFNQTTFERLHSFRFQNDATSRLCDFVFGVVAVTNKPSLKIFRGERLLIETPSPSPPKRFVGLEEVYLRSCHIDGSQLHGLLHIYRNIKVLDIQWTDLVQNVLDFDLMGKVLRLVGTGLRRLTLDPKISPTFVHGLHNGCLGSLKELSHLSYLRIPLSILLYHHTGAHDHGHYELLYDLFSVLPESVETLEVICTPNPIFPDTPPALDPISALYPVFREDKLPRLNRIEILLGVQDHKVRQIESEAGIRDHELTKTNWRKIDRGTGLLLRKIDLGRWEDIDYN